MYTRKKTTSKPCLRNICFLVNLTLRFMFWGTGFEEDWTEKHFAHLATTSTSCLKIIKREIKSIQASLLHKRQRNLSPINAWVPDTRRNLHGLFEIYVSLQVRFFYSSGDLLVKPKMLAFMLPVTTSTNK